MPPGAELRAAGFLDSQPRPKGRGALPITVKNHVRWWLPAVLLLAAGCVSRQDLSYERVLEDALQRQSQPAAEEPVEQPAKLLLDEPLTLEHAIALALARNPDYRGTFAGIRQAAAMLAESRAAFRPRVSADLGYYLGDAAAPAFVKLVDGRAFSPELDVNDPGVRDFFETAIDVRYTVYNGGRDLLRRWQAETGRELSELDRQVAGNALVAAVIDAFFSVLAAGDMVETAAASVAMVEAQLKDTRLGYEVGNVLKSDVLSLEVRRLQAVERRIRAENGEQLAKAALANLLGGDPDTPLEVTDTIRQPDLHSGDDFWDLPADYPTAVSEAMATRPELAQARLHVEHAAIGLDSERAGKRPRLDTGVRAYLTEEDNPGFDAGDLSWWAQLNLSWNVFDGGVRRARVDQARAMLDKSILADRKVTLAIQLDVKTAYLRIAEARARLEVAEAAVRHADESLELVRARYDAGEATVTRYLNAEQMRTEARMGRTHAGFDLRKSLADGARALGLFAVEIDDDGGSDE